MYFFNIKYNIIKAALTVFFLGGVISMYMKKLQYKHVLGVFCV